MVTLFFVGFMQFSVWSSDIKPPLHIRFDFIYCESIHNIHPDVTPWYVGQDATYFIFIFSLVGCDGSNLQ